MGSPIGSRKNEPHTLKGTKHLWFEADAEPLTSDVQAVLTSEAGGAFSLLRYRWEHDGKPCDGVMLIHRHATVGGPAISWADSFHQSGAMMVCTCKDVDPSSLTGLGAYAAPPGPDWGWRIIVEWLTDGNLMVHMKNVWPDGREDRAVEIVLG